MKKKLFLFCLILLGTVCVSAETWTPIGQVKWTEGALTGQKSSYNKTWNVSVERSDTRPQVFRLQPYASNPFSNMGSVYIADNVYVYLHTENPNQVYFEYYIYYYYDYFYYDYGYFEDKYYYHVWQRCPENGFDSRYYGKIIDNTTIEFPVGSFAVNNYETSSKQPAPSSWAQYSTSVHKIVFPKGVFEPEPETFVNVGKGLWKDGLFAGSEAKEVAFERSLLRTNVFRATPYNYTGDDSPVVIHTENSSKVWLEPFTAGGYKFTQQVSENVSGPVPKYGTMTNGRIEIPGEYFSKVSVSDNQTPTTSGGTLVITLPEGYNTPIENDNGIFMGVISFNDKIDNLPINVLNRYTEPMFTGFVNNMEMENATLLYYAVDQAITTLAQPEYPENLSNAMIVTFTDGLDQGSLAMAPEHLTSRNYAQYISDRISSTQIQGLPLQAYTIGLKGDDVEDDELFEQNLRSLSSDSTKYHSVTDIESVQEELTKIYEELNRQTSKRVVSIAVPMMSHGDTYRFTLDGITTAEQVNDSERWIEGVFDITDNSFNDVTYHGITSASGSKITAERSGIYIIFTFNDCRDEDGEILEVEKNDIDQWTYVASKGTWQHNLENDKDGKINIEDIRTSAAIMFVLDCSRSLGDLFEVLKQTANSFIDRLAGGDGNPDGIDEVTADRETVDPDAPVEYFNLQGIRVQNPGRGLYIRRQGNSVTKVLMK